ncbi:flagellar basal body FlgE domain-containing protein, partial [Klebsiella variicola]|uniref:flagellar basal body FlgE domain-containing protein n=3 Tax=Pseudomonadota TaxID=1224 RepID=UPI0029FF3FE7
SFTVYDQQGGSHTLNMAFIKTGPNAWKAEVYSNPPGDVMDTSVTPPVKSTSGFIAGGDVNFKPDGSLDLPAGSWLNSALNITYSNQAASV